MFQPSMLGIDQAGLAELIDFILAKFNPNDQQKLVQVFYNLLKENFHCSGQIC